MISVDRVQGVSTMPMKTVEKYTMTGKSMGKILWTVPPRLGGLPPSADKARGACSTEQSSSSKLLSLHNASYQTHYSEPNAGYACSALSAMCRLSGTVL